MGRAPGLPGIVEPLRLVTKVMGDDSDCTHRYTKDAQPLGCRFGWSCSPKSLPWLKCWEKVRKGDHAGFGRRSRAHFRHVKVIIQEIKRGRWTQIR